MVDVFSPTVAANVGHAALVVVAGSDGGIAMNTSVILDRVQEFLQAWKFAVGWWRHAIVFGVLVGLSGLAGLDLLVCLIWLAGLVRVERVEEVRIGGVRVVCWSSNVAALSNVFPKVVHSWTGRKQCLLRLFLVFETEQFDDLVSVLT